MGLTYKSCKIKSLEDSFNIKQKENSYVVALAGNPSANILSLKLPSDNKPSTSAVVFIFTSVSLFNLNSSLKILAEANIYNFKLWKYYINCAK